MISDPFLRKLVEDALRSGQLRPEDLDPTSSIRKRPMPWDPQSAGGPGPNVLGALMASGMGKEVPRETPPPPVARLSLAQKFGPIPFVNNQPMRKDQVPRLALRGLLAGFNSRAGFPGSDAGGVLNGKPVNPLERLRFEETVRHNKATEGNAGADNARADAMLKLAEEKAEWYRQHGDETNARLAEALADKIRHEGVTEGQGDRRLDITIRGQDISHGDRQARLALSKQSEARRAKVADAMLKWPPIMQKEYMSHERTINNLYDEGVIDAGGYESRINALMDDFEQRNQGLKNPFGADEYGAPRVQSGKSSTVKPGAAPVKKKGFLESIFSPKEEKKADPLGLR